MSVSGISAAASSHVASHQAAQLQGHRRHGGSQPSFSLTDIDMQGSSVVTTPSATGKLGSKVNISA